MMTPVLRLLQVCLIVVAIFGAHAKALAADSIQITDIADRKVTIKRPIKKIVLGEGRQILALSLIHPDPVALIAGWPADLPRQDKVTYERYRQKFPTIADIPFVGQGSADTFSVEQALAVQPDVAILSGGYGPSRHSTDIIERLEAAGVAVIFIDFVSKPLENTVPSIRILGQLLGQEQNAERYIDVYQTHMRRIADRLATAQPALPKVLMHAHAGLGDCCNSPARATIGAFIDAAGGHNIAVDVLKQPFGQLNPEYVLAQDPDVYVGTGGIHLVGKGGLAMGPGIEARTTHAALEAIIQAPVLAGLKAVRNGRVYGIWHLFSNMPMNFLAVEILAKWFHPELFADIDPDASLRLLNEEFLPVPLEGTYWVSLR
jgi:iron complex transport system substrate-binding protein